MTNIHLSTLPVKGCVCVLRVRNPLGETERSERQRASLPLPERQRGRTNPPPHQQINELCPPESYVCVCVTVCVSPASDDLRL